MTALTRAAAALRPAAEVRLVHLGLGSFFRAHQAWYTDQATDASQWGYAAFAGRSKELARTLSDQGGAYTLVVRGTAGSRLQHVASLSRAHAADDHAAWLEQLASPRVSVVTLTVTESGYRRTPEGQLDLAAADVAHDVLVLRSSPAAPVHTAPGRLLAGLMARRHRGSGPISVVPCDNLSGNGAALRTVLTQLAGEVDPSLEGWLAHDVSFVNTVVDRITPATTATDTAEVEAATGFADRASVVTEEFTEWLLAGEFPTGRPAWESAGARCVSDVAPYERRKLWLLNGAHSLIAYAGSVRGHETVAEAVSDPRIGEWVEAWWDEASRHLDLDPSDIGPYRSALLERFGNPHLRHLLAQIAADGSQKLTERVVPVLRIERTAGRLPRGATRILAAWTLHLLGRGSAPVSDDAVAGSADLRAASSITETAAVALRLVAPELEHDDALLRLVVELTAEIGG